MLGMVWVAVMGLLTVGLLGFARDLSARQRAQHAADAAALAALDGDRALAAQVAARSHATIVSVVWLGTVVEVRVRVGDHDATARATRAP